jgi:hypothetical protein
MGTRIASCCCGKLNAETSGEPAFIVACHCRECQRRTGSVFGVGAYFPKSQVKLKSGGKMYVRDGQDGRKLRMHFCEDCGSTVFWELDITPNLYGIAVGTFAAPDFSSPTVSVWEENRHYWVTFTHDLRRLQQQLTAEEAASF